MEGCGEVLVLRNVDFSYTGRNKQIQSVSLNVRRGECIVLTGASGCGKTSLVRLINGMVPHFYEGVLSGEVFIAGRDASQMHSWEFGRIVGNVFQDPRSQFFASVVQDEIAFGCENYGVPSREIRRRIDEVVGVMGLEGMLERDLFTISDGEKQRVAVAASRVLSAAIYVMDEPSANLDQRSTRYLQRIIEQLKAEGRTVVVAEHRLRYLTEVADRILYMQSGRIVEEFAPDELQRFSFERLDRMGLRYFSEEPAPFSRRSVSREEPELLRVEDLSVHAGRRTPPLLEQVSFSVRAGEVVALTGANGVGKTTLARVLCGLGKERRGKVFFRGLAVRPRSRHRYAWFVMQDADAQLFTEDVFSELILGMRNREHADEDAERILRELNLWKYRARHPASLSGGEKQRVAIAVALVQERDVLILDEPTSGLDAANMRQVAAMIRKAADERKAVLIITHDEELIFHACSRIVHFEDGRLHRDVSVSSETFQAKRFG